MEFSDKFTRIDCCSCHFPFAVPDSVVRSWRESHRNFYCPSCHTCQSFQGESTAERYKRLYQDRDACCTRLYGQLEHKERQLNGTKGAMGLLRKQRDEARGVVAPEREKEE